MNSQDLIEESSSSSSKRRRVRTRPGTGVEIEEYDDLPGPTLLKRTLGLQNLHHSQYVGPNDVLHAYGPRGFTSRDISQEGEASRSKETVRFVHPSHAFRIIPDSATIDYSHERALADEVEAAVEGHGPELVHLYFRIVHPSFPVLHKEVFIEKYKRSYREFSPPLLAAVYLLASGYWTYCEKLAKESKPDLSQLRRLACASLHTAMRRPKLSTIQAGLLVSQVYNANEQSLHSKLTAELVDLAYGLGLHLDASDWDIPSWEVSLRRRLGWAVFMQDKWTALLEGHPSLLSYDDWEVRGLCENDFPESDEDDEEGSSEVQKGRLVFINMASLAEVLAEILRNVFSARARRTLDAAQNPFAVLLDRVRPLQIKLKNWFTSLPTTVKMDTAASMKLSSVGYLRLAYLTVEVCLYRHLVKVLPDISAATPATPIYRAAARERFDNAVDFVQRLQAQHLASFWYFASARSCALLYSFGQALESTSSTAGEHNYFNKKLREFKWALKVNSEAGAAFMKVALGLIEHSTVVVAFSPAVLSSTTSPTYDPDGSITSISPATNDPQHALHGFVPQHSQQPYPAVMFDVNATGQTGWHFDDPFGFGAGHWMELKPTSGGINDGMG